MLQIWGGLEKILCVENALQMPLIGFECVHMRVLVCMAFRACPPFELTQIGTNQQFST